MMKSFASLLAAFSLFYVCGAIAAVPSNAPMTTEILSASPHATLVRCTFDETAVAAALASAQDDFPGEGFGMILAIAPEGIPHARILHLELGASSYASSTEHLPQTENEIVTVSSPAILHDLRVAAVNLRPAIASGNAVRSVRSLDVEVSTEGVGGPNPKTPPSTFSFAFYPLYKSVISNLDELHPDISLGKPGRFAVIGPSVWLNNIPSNWRVWKQRKGYELVMVPYSIMGDSSITGIYNYISMLYHQPDAAPLEYALLLGDVTGYNYVPSFRVQNPDHQEELDVADNPFFTVDGDDYLPDVLHGRVSVATSSEIATILSKVANYEMTPDLTNPSWFTRGIAVAGNYNDGAGTFPVTPVWNCIWAREQLMAWNYTDVDTFYWRNWGDPPPEQYTPLICNSWNEGASVVFYRGWGNARGWQYPTFLIDDMDEIHSGRELPAMFSIVCGTGDFGNANTNPCFGEKLLRMGSVNQPNGIISFYGASDLHTNTKQNNAVLGGIIEGMRFGGLRSMGAITLAGELELYRSFPDQIGDGQMVEFYLDVFNILGDPETHLWLGTPKSFDVTAPTTVGSGEHYIPVAVSSQGQPIENAVVTVRGSNWNLRSTMLTDASGSAVVPIYIEGNPPLQLTVWKAGYLPVNRDIDFTTGDLELSVFNESYSGGGDAIPNPGETVSLTLTVGNMGASASGVEAELSSLDPKVTVTQSHYSFGDFPGSTTLTQATPFTIELAGNLCDGERPELQVRFTDAASHTTDRTILIPVRAPLLVPTYIYADDANGVLDPGETADMIVNLTNFGGQNAENVSASLYSWDNSIEILDGDGAWGSIAAGDSGRNNDNKFRIRAEAGATRGREVLLRFNITANGIAQNLGSLAMTIGQVQPTDPTGPDEYGYRAYENLDVGFSATPTYNWIELDPDHGGSGAQAHPVHDEDIVSLTLPQSFVYYGQSYDTVWLCSNGWLSFGPARIAEFRNWPLPAPIGAPALVAPLWDDLNCWDAWIHGDSTFSIFTRYDAPEHRFIMEWSRAANRFGRETQVNYEETFEVILEFPQVEGDGSLLFQYLAASNVDINNNQFTTGFEDYNHQRGLNLTYANTYPASMNEITAGRAIRITTAPPDAFSSADEPLEPLPTEFALHAPYPNPFNATTEIRYDLPKAGEISLRVFDLLGREVAVLKDGFSEAGSHRVSFDGSNLASGIYFARFEANQFVQTRKLLLVK